MNDTHHGRPDRFKVEIGDENLNFRTVELDDPVPTGRQLIKAANAHPVEEFVASAFLADGTLEDLRLDELFDLRGRGVERVLVVRTDRSFRFFADGKEVEWPKPVVSGLVLKRLAGVDPARHDVYQEIRGADDILVRNTDLVDLTKPGVERFFTAVAQTTEGLSALPPRDATYLETRGIAHDVFEEGGYRGVVLRGFALPEGKFNVPAADILILLPPGYPDCAPDMFYCIPWLTLAATGTEARATQVRQTFQGLAWQRWSRHNTEWRPGIDGLHTMVKRVERALAEAA
ncbi:multiubiquitin domain-containing protein [Methylorubrum thiocyanatum]|uniref:multiubiquitin domain-containing protein n=1 Tax=Methylorubrum thiocyanatum TaxID=47958 RepID=UPI00398C2DD6